MTIETPCSACSFTPKRQKGCCYESHVKLFYEASDRGVWSLGSRLVLKERSASPPNFDAENIQFLGENTTIPVPNIVEAWGEENGRYFIITKRVPGEPLSAAWGSMSSTAKDRVAKQVAEYLLQLRQLHSPRLQSLEGKPIYSAFLFSSDFGVPHGPFDSDDELWEEMAKSLEGVPQKARQRMRERMPCATPYTFTHGDLTTVNIMVEDGNLTGIIDWEDSGYYPVWWEYACTGIGLSQHDVEWKTLLRKYMPEHEDGRQFWRQFWMLAKYPNLDDAGAALLGDLEQ
ncbi:hypothetical protein NW762_003687 [Fusarium torreyae]|uniref:Aminoglycoside phosphotransferase domain-containing protein n=1 Tax=Fusarium torreyae TaxID=1237075 RepID=A0A9W8SAR9_9HYPO|nr:hypothetical protein NW762_003687 [Fusarium torreyae]